MFGCIVSLLARLLVAALGMNLLVLKVMASRRPLWSRNRSWARFTDLRATPMRLATAALAVGVAIPAADRADVLVDAAIVAAHPPACR